jgi:hypothetical protein
MLYVPPEILPILTDLGIQQPTECRWKRLEEWPLRRMRAHYYCPCGTRPDGQQRVELAFCWLGGRRVFIGQCGWCMTIYWRDAVKAG